VHVRIGELRQVVPDTLIFCWSMVTSGTGLAGCELDVERVRAVLCCRACDAEHPMGEYLALACRSCGALDVDVVSGEEFLVTALDLAAVDSRDVAR